MPLYDCHTMKYEVEQKFRVNSLDEPRTRLAELGAVFAPAVTQIDLYLAHPSRDFAQTDEALRIRRTGDQNRVTYKGPRIDKTTKTRKELELPLLQGDAGLDGFRELFVSLGFQPAGEVHKVREEARLTRGEHNVVVALDSVTGAGAFVEIEIEAEEAGIAAAQQTLAELAAELSLLQHERRSYLELILGDSFAPDSDAS